MFMTKIFIDLLPVEWYLYIYINTTMMKISVPAINRTLPFILLGILFLLDSCAPPGDTETRYGFLMGIVHGLAFPFALVSKLIGMNFGLYALNNTGFWYWLGFILGVSAYAGSGAAVRRRRR